MDQVLGPFLIGLVAMGIIMLRNARGRKLRVERLWLYPSIMIAGVLTLIAADPPVEPLVIAALVAITALGAGIGWYRGKLTRIELNPETHELTSRASPVAMALILILFLVRYGLRSWLTGPEASLLHLGAARITDGFLLFTVGIVVTQRIEIWLRCRKMLAEAKTPAV